VGRPSRPPHWVLARLRHDGSASALPPRGAGLGTEAGPGREAISSYRPVAPASAGV